ncbi:MAG: hypothetical protein HOD43_00425 [Candidatus Marinimicrobia bacterium]|jgi:hypothetical protein|nr:hypothetical protein [Candidatus Neomarinimicrobiota bacterium]MBT3630811.1 hypothetical protein [Candidatus Neomarinimicrobiota bacterium]MBT3823473.1 hypothetical protein [Candidatus Neomarinimicrobiota bacterium]MBT4130443.1 hypothetical protein [Candidatus Neomarinimicrobiota bacterium]MBT4294252.1 hypothetical protein [Candidatus Neomarinimicrobiota bacterium]
MPHFQQYLATESLAFQPAGLQEAIYKTLKYTEERAEFETANDSFRKLIRIVKRQLLVSLTHLQEFEAAVLLAFENDPDQVDKEIFSTIASIEDVCEVAERQNFPVEILKVFQEIRDSNNEETTGYSRRKVWIPLVEKIEDTPGKEIIVGTIYPLELDIEARQNERSRDIITFNNHPLAQDDLVNYQAQDALKAARSRHKFLKKPKTSRYTVAFGFPSVGHYLAGASFGFGMSLLALCAFEREANLRKQYSVSKSTAFTGGIDFTGQMRAVNSVGLDEKIATVFYSSLTSLVVPQENAFEAQMIVDELLLKHPQKKFSLIPEQNLQQMLENRDILIYKKMPLIEWARNHITRSLILKTFLHMMLAVLLTLGAISIFSDDNPSEYKVEGESVLIFNNTGKFLWSIDLGHTPDYLEVINPRKPIYRRLQINDYDGDGENEVLLGTQVKQHEFNGRLYYLETDGTVKWMFSEHPILQFGGAEYTDNYGVGFIFPFKHANSTVYDIYARFSHMPWFPNRLVRFDINGTQLDEFIHPGGIYDMEVCDLNQDGEMEIILGCTNNAFNDAAVAIIPSRGFKGTTPRWENTRQLDGSKVDSNLIYIKFPTWGDYDFNDSGARSHVDDIFLDSDRGFIVSVVLGGTTETGSYLYSFDLNLNLTGLSVSDGFLSQYHRKNSRDFFEEFDRAEWYEKMTQIDVWRDGQWLATSRDD